MRKKSGKLVAQTFLRTVDRIDKLLVDNLITPIKESERTALYEWGVIKLHAAFETFMLESLVAAINQDTRTVGKKLGVALPAHLQDDASEYLVTHGGYFSTGDRAALIQKFKQFLPDSHPLVIAITNLSYRTSISRLIALRNLAAHGNSHSRKAATKAVGRKKTLTSAGVWLKEGSHRSDLVWDLKSLAGDVDGAFRY